MWPGIIMQMRMIMGQSLGDGFNVKDIWEKARRNWGQLFAVTLIPMAIVIGISLVLSIVVFSIMFLCIMGAAPTIAAIGGAADPSFAQIMSLIAALAGPMIFCTLILYVVLSVGGNLRRGRGHPRRGPLGRPLRPRMDDAFRSALLINYRQNKNGWQRAGPHMRQQHSELGSTQPPKPRLSLSCW